MKARFSPITRLPLWSSVSEENWADWHWQMRHTLKSEEDFAKVFALSESERVGLKASGTLFKVAVTPYYASLAHPAVSEDPIRRIFIPTGNEINPGVQQMEDPLAEKKHQVSARVIHRYSDRVLFWVTDTCSVYCRYCTRKHFTGQGAAAPLREEYEQALDYISKHKGIREVILSGGDPLTLADKTLIQILSDLRKLEHIEIIRLGTRMPVVNPYRVTVALAQALQKYQPIFLMTHFNHPRELTQEAYQALTRFVDHGIPVLNQMVLLNGVNNHPAIVQALSRRLLLARTKPYYMFQCDPSRGTDHLRNSVDDSLKIQKELWGHLSGLAMPTLSLDIPNGGGKASLVPQFEVHRKANKRSFVGWDGVQAEYISPSEDDMLTPLDSELYIPEWEQLKAAKT